MDSLLIDTTLRHVAEYARVIGRVQNHKQISGNHVDPTDLAFAREVAQAAVDEGGNLPVLLSLAIRLRATSDAMAHHHPRIAWVEAHDRVQWGYVSVFVRTFALALSEAIERGESHGGAADLLRLSEDTIERVAGSISVDGIARLEHALERTIAITTLVDVDAALDERVERFAATPWPTIVGAPCAG